MAKLDGFMALLTGSFNNREQYDALQKEGKEFPYAEHMNTAVSYTHLQGFCQGETVPGP